MDILLLFFSLFLLIGFSKLSLMLIFSISTVAGLSDGDIIKTIITIIAIVN